MLKEIKTVSSIKRGDNISYLNSPKPDNDIMVYDDYGFGIDYRDIIIHKTNGSRDVLKFNYIGTQVDTKAGTKESLWYGVSSGWIIYALQSGTNTEYYKVFDSGDICTNINQFKLRFGNL